MVGRTEFNAGVLRLRPDSDRGSERPLPRSRDADAPLGEGIEWLKTPMFQSADQGRSALLVDGFEFLA